MIVHVSRTTVDSSVGDAKAAIIADLRATFVELKCIASERLVRQGISMTQLHVMHLLQGHGEMPMSRLAEMLDVSLSNATGLIDRVEERGVVERVRVAEDRRMVMVRLTPLGRETLDEIEALREQVLRRVLDRLDEAKLVGMASAMADLRTAIATNLTDREHPDTHQHTNTNQRGN